MCSYCGVNCEANRDHFYPKSRGGKTLIWSCKDCNHAKGRLLPEEWVIKIDKSLHYSRHKKNRMIDATYRFISMIPIELRDWDEDRSEVESAIDLRNILKMEKKKKETAITVSVVHGRGLPSGGNSHRKHTTVICKCGIKKTQLWVNTYKMVRFWKDGNYQGMKPKGACSTCQFTE